MIRYYERSPTGCLDAFTARARQNAAVLRAAVVGSRARETARADSDIDLVILCQNPALLLNDDSWLQTWGKTTSTSDATTAGVPAATNGTGLEVHPVTPDRWEDMVTLFETSSVMSSCRCMNPRARAKEFSRFGAESRRRNREAMHGVPAVEAYPLDAWGERVGPSDAYTGIAGTFRDLGFEEVRANAGRSRGQPRLIMRYDLRRAAQGVSYN